MRDETTVSHDEHRCREAPLDADEQRPAVLADPTVAQLSQAKANRIVFPTKDLSAAITFASVLSYPAVADQLPPLLTAALA